VDQPAYHAAKLTATHSDLYQRSPNDSGPAHSNLYTDLYFHRYRYPAAAHADIHTDGDRDGYSHPHAPIKAQSRSYFKGCDSMPSRRYNYLEVLTGEVLPDSHFDGQFTEVHICSFENSRGESCSHCSLPH
jgi:hypothetical protein